MQQKQIQKHVFSSLQKHNDYMYNSMKSVITTNVEEAKSVELKDSVWWKNVSHNISENGELVVLYPDKWETKVENLQSKLLKRV